LSRAPRAGEPAISVPGPLPLGRSLVDVILAAIEGRHKRRRARDPATTPDDRVRAPDGDARRERTGADSPVFARAAGVARALHTGGADTDVIGNDTTSARRT